MLAFRILHEDESLVVIDKPAGFHSHPPEDKLIRISPRWNGLAILERQLGQKLYPAHRLDRATSGILIFSKVRALNRALQEQFQERAASKTYFCLVRGSLKGTGDLKDSLKNESGSEDEARTLVEEIFSFTLPIAGPNGPERVFTIVKANPITGRFHQIRRHLARIGLPIVGDSRHGDRRVNREFAQLIGIDRLFLRCMEICLVHPDSGREIFFKTKWSKDWHRLFDRAGFCPIALPYRAPPSPF